MLTDALLPFVSGSGVGDMVNFTISITNDMLVEQLLETFTVNLDAVPGGRAIVSGISTATVGILEDLTDGKSFPTLCYS